MAHEQSPFLIKCSSCGQQADFDIMTQSYRCAYCGNVDSVGDALASFKARQKAGEQRVALEARKYPRAVYNCPNCGAEISVEEGEAGGICDYCGGKLVRSEFTDAANMPWTIIPFVLTKTEAAAQLTAWCDAHVSAPEAHALRKKISSLKGAYLPYQYIAGSVVCNVSQDNSERIYRCAGKLEDTPVNTVRNLDNELLDAIEPFDSSGIREFEFGWIAGQKVKLQDVSEAELKKRIVEEVRHDYSAIFAKKFGTQGIGIMPHIDNMLNTATLLPIYFIKQGKETLAAVNGQTGRVAVNTKRYKRDYKWAIEAGLATLVVLLIMMYLFREVYEVWYECIVISMAIAGVAGIFFFGILGQNRDTRGIHVIYDNGVISAVREGNILRYVTSSNDKQLKASVAPPVLFERQQDNWVPVDMRFYTPARVAMLLFIGLFALFVPVVLAALLRLIQVGLGGRAWAELFADFDISYGAAWYCIGFFLMVVAWTKAGRRLVFDFPIFRRIMPDGSFGPFDTSNSSVEGSLLGTILRTGLAILCFLPLTIFFALLLIGSACAIAF